MLARLKPWRHAALCLLYACLTMTAALALGMFSDLLPDLSREKAPVSADTRTPVFVIDAGHGGEDGGASGEDGTPEKTLNLEIALRMGDLAELLGYPVLLTRTEDTLLYDLYDDLTDYTGKKKTYDLRNRLRATEESGCAMFCSIHMNKFPQAKYSGLQVYYSPNTDESRNIAALVQSYVRTFLDPENQRETKKATSAIYLLHRLRTPAVLVECGFLSNPAECALLNTAEYRMKLSAVLTAALAEAFEAGERGNRS